jgi:mono/diheme cytochrome c family protein
MTAQSRTRGTMLAIVALLLAGSGDSLRAGSNWDEKDSGYIKHGRALYLQYCVACHGRSGKGDGPAAAAFEEPPADLTTISYRYKGFPTDKVMVWIDGEKASTAHGTREMPVWGKRFRHERGIGGALGDVYALTKYLESIQPLQK